MYDTQLAQATPFQLQLHNEAKARRARYAAIARTATNPPPPPVLQAPPVVTVTPPVEHAAPQASPMPNVVVPPEPFSIHTRAMVIMHDVARKHEVTVEILTGPSRRAPHCVARFEAVYRVANATGWSLPRLGRFFGGRDHTSILHAIKRVEELYPEDQLRMWRGVEPNEPAHDGEVAEV